MACRKLRTALLCIMIFLLPANNLFAAKKSKKVEVQLVDGESTSGEESEEETNPEDSWQLLEWEADDVQYTLRFAVKLERKNEETGKYEEYLETETEDNTCSIKLEPALHPGVYRYAVAPYNLLGIKEDYSDWEEFRILKAFQPEVNEVLVNVNKTNTIYFDEFNDGLLTINGRNLFEVPKTDTDVSYTNYTLVNSKLGMLKTQLFPLGINQGTRNTSDVIFRLNMDDIDTGRYYLMATDASGLRTEKNKSNELIIKFKKAVDFDLAGGYYCPVILFDDTFKTYMGSSAWPISLMGKITFMPVKKKIGYFGGGFEAFYTRMDNKMEHYEIGGNLASGFLTFVYQFPIKLKKNNKHLATIEIHGGGGVDYLMGYQFKFAHDLKSETLNSMNLAVLAGGSVQIYLLGRLYVEANVDFTTSFMKDMAFGVLRPGALIGWQF